LEHKHWFKQTKQKNSQNGRRFAVGITALLSFLIGALSALRGNVLVLVPVIATAVLIVALIGIARGEDAGSLAVDMMVSVTCIEAGYIAKLVAYALVDAPCVAVIGRSLARSSGRSTRTPAA
jgi:hypothetical protein